jgi:hypothetical protein
LLDFLGTSQEGGGRTKKKKEEEQQTKQHKNKAKNQVQIL